MFSLFRNFLNKTYHPLNNIQLSSQALLQNYNFLSSLNKNIRVAPVLKSNAYGHGIQLIAKVLDKVQAPFFCVDSLYEAYQLQKSGIKTKVLIMGYVDPVNIEYKKLPFSYAVFNEEQLLALNKYQKGAGIHIFFDSGMHREGISLEKLPIFLQKLKLCKNIYIEGFMSHFAESEFPASELTKNQLDNIQQALNILKNEKINPPWIHVANSGGLLRWEELSLDNFSNMARAGTILYGIDPRPEYNSPFLHPVLQLTSKIIQIKKLKKGDQVGYNGTYTAQEDMVAGVLPIGYADGLDRRLSNKGFVKIDNVFCPIIGRVSMNITVIDISQVENPYVGKEVIIFSNNPEDKNSIKQIANARETIAIDLLVHISQSIQRKIV